MAYYCKITDSCIRELKQQWDEFIRDCFYEVQKQYEELCSSYSSEASEDKSSGKYSEESIDEWYEDCINKLDESVGIMKDEINELNRKGSTVINEIANKKFYYDSYNKPKFVLDFVEGKIREEYSENGNYCVEFSSAGMHINDVDIEFDPPRPEFTEWMLSKSR